jgi:hypothetical protein
MKHLSLSLVKKFTLISFLVAGLAACGSSNPATTTQPGAAPVLTGLEQQTVHLGQPVIQLELNHNDMNTTYETHEVPAICTRTVQNGTHTECHTEYSQQCSTQMEQVCRNVSYPVCQNTSETVCRDVPEQVCHGTPPHQQCTTVPRRVCQVENHQTCHNENRQECTNVPQQHCENVPHQACINVPTTIQEQYSCMQPQQVPVETLRMHELARITINVLNPRNLDISRDDIVFTLNQGNISAVAQSASGIRYQIRQTAQTQNQTGPTEELITASFEVDVMF